MASSFLDLLTQKQPSVQTKQALLVLGLQNDFVTPTGQLPVESASSLLAKVQTVVPVFRENAGDVIWVQTVFRQNRTVNDPSGEGDTVLLDGDDFLAESSDESGDDASPKTTQQALSKARTNRHKQRALDLFKKVSARRRSTREPSPVPAEEDETFLSGDSRLVQCCAPNTESAEFPSIVKNMIDSSTDMIIQSSSYSAFNSTSLLINLRAKLVTELYICGCLTNISVYATALDAARHGISINLIDDCLGYRKITRHEEALRQMADVMGANLISSEEILEVLNVPAGSDKPIKQGEIERDESEIGNLVEKLNINDDSSAPTDDKFRRRSSLAALRQAALSATSPHRQKDDVVPKLPPLPRPDETPTRLKASRSQEKMILQATGSPQQSKAREKERESPGLVKSKVRMRQRAKKSLNDLKSVDAKASGSQSTKASTKERQELPEGSEPPSLESTGNAMSPEKDAGRLSHKSSRRFPSLKLTKSQPQLAVDSTPSKSSDTPKRPKSFGLPGTSKKAEDSSDKARPHSLTAIGSKNRKPEKDVETHVSHNPTVTYNKSKKPPSLATHPILGPQDQIAEGDSRIMYDFFPPTFQRNQRSSRPYKDEIFSLLYNEVKWQTMHHNQGEVPRLVCAQGAFGKDGSMPIYRHPSDTALPLLHFSPSVQLIRERVQSLVKHPVNHVLIQLYRSGTDHITEHSDKTLDIARTSTIINVSFGAQRTMRLRTKRATTKVTEENAASPETRTTQRVALPHNSMFVLGPSSNQRWLHGIQPDKRPSSDRSPAETAHAGMRISLTFRHIATFIDGSSSSIWGQGATSKRREDAAEVINDHEEHTARLINAFGQENQSTDFDWDAVYGAGFDVLHFRRPPDDVPILFAGKSQVANAQVLSCLAELGITHTMCAPPPPPPGDVADRGGARIMYRDADSRHTEVHGAVPILLYLDRYHQFDRSEQGKPTTAFAYQILFQAEKFYDEWDNRVDKDSLPETCLAMLDAWDDLNDLHGADYIAGTRLSIADCAVWPLLDAVIGSGISWDRERFPRMDSYYRRLGALKKSFGKLREKVLKAV